MSTRKKPAPVVHHTAQTLEQRCNELSEIHRSLEEGSEKERISKEIDDTVKLINGLTKYKLDHGLAVKVTVSKVNKI